MSFLQSPVGLIIVGGIAGVASGVFGIGGGLVMVPIFVYLMKMDQHHATATSLAIVLLPVALPAVIRLHRAGNVEWRYVLWVALGFALCSQFGAKINIGLSELYLRRVFAVLLIFAAIQMALKPPKNAAKPAAPAAGQNH